MEKISAHTAKEHYRTEIQSEKHIIVSDEPAASGGSDMGLSPKELLLASLASCTSITLRMYADRKTWPLDDVKVDVSYGNPTAEGATKIIREITLSGQLDDAQRARLLAVANSCPVHKILSGTIDIDTHSA